MVTDSHRRLDVILDYVLDISYDGVCEGPLEVKIINDNVNA